MASGERAVASFLAAVLIEIYLCASCSCHEMLRSATARVRLDEVADTASGRTYLRVSRVDPGSEAHRQL
eukprot:COSAG01_NODE_44943_length_414_cov_0.657143_1_plen_68_part_10